MCSAWSFRPRRQVENRIPAEDIFFLVVELATLCRGIKIIVSAPSGVWPDRELAGFHNVGVAFVSFNFAGALHLF
jgi:hypothetical protein